MATKGNVPEKREFTTAEVKTKVRVKVIINSFLRWDGSSYSYSFINEIICCSEIKLFRFFRPTRPGNSISVSPFSCSGASAKFEASI